MSEKSTFNLFESDLRSIIKILAKLGILDGTVRQKKEYVLKSLAGLIGADCWAYVQLPKVTDKEVPVAADILHGGFSDERFARYLQAIEHQDMAALNAPFLQEIIDTKSHTTKLRQDLDPDNKFPQMPVYHLWQEANIAPLLLSGMPTTDGNIGLIALYRNSDKKLFTAREAKIAHLVLSEVDWLYDVNPQTVKGNRFDYFQLSPRIRTVLNLLLEGLARKQIAAHLDISENTVSGYIQEVYRFYHVNSHAELINHFRCPPNLRG